MTPTQQTYYLIGIKGVAMTALAQVLTDAGHRVVGSDVAEDFVTAGQLKRLKIQIDDFATLLPASVSQVIYTAAHQASHHPQVQAAVQRGLPAFSHAEALGQWFNQKEGVAVCGVGGKSTISAMITWILQQAGRQPSFAVGVGDILGLGRTGRWNEAGSTFVAEADEYATDPVAVHQGQTLIPRFHYLQPKLIVASAITFDHPDVYRDEAHTRAVFLDWFTQLGPKDALIAVDTNRSWLAPALPDTAITWYGQAATSDYVLCAQPVVANQTNLIVFVHRGQTYHLTLRVPGTYNALNALAAIAATEKLGVPIAASVKHLASFRSTKRRFEQVGTINGIECYDDYAHHPRELAAVIEAAHQWFAGKRLIIAFQPHTYSRTKALLQEFVTALRNAPELILLDIFSSARESFDPTISSDLLLHHLLEINPTHPVQNLHTIDHLAHYCQQQLRPGDVLLTLGAGDIYKVHALLGAAHD